MNSTAIIPRLIYSLPVVPCNLINLMLEKYNQFD